MINKFKYIKFILVMSFSINAAYCHEAEDEIFLEACDAYPYVSIGVGPIVFIPNIGIGYRKRYDQFGFDSSLSFSTIGWAHQLTGHLVGHYYLSPYQHSTYLGLGLLGSGIIMNDGYCGGTLSPDFVFGKELKVSDKRRHFLEMHVAVPTVLTGSKPKGFYLPLMYIKYGISF